MQSFNQKPLYVAWEMSPNLAIETVAVYWRQQRNHALAWDYSALQSGVMQCEEAQRLMSENVLRNIDALRAPEVSPFRKLMLLMPCGK